MEGNRREGEKGKEKVVVWLTGPEFSVILCSHSRPTADQARPLLKKKHTLYSVYSVFSTLYFVFCILYSAYKIYATR